MHLNGINGGQTFTDYIGHSVSVASGQPVITTDLSKFGGSSLSLDGASFISTPASSDWDFSGGIDFTIELWAKILTNSGFQGLISTWDNWALHYTSGAIIFQSASHTIQGSISLVDGNWHHIAVSCRNGIVRILVDGGLVVSDGQGDPYNSGNIALDIGYINGGFLSGAIDEIRIIKGAGLYGGNFIPYNQAFPDHIVTPISLTTNFNLLGITTDGTTYSGGLDSEVPASSTLSTNLIGTFQNCDGIPFMLGQADALNAIKSENTVITIPTGNYDAISILALTFNGDKEGNFVITYNDSSTDLIVQTITTWTNTNEVENKKSSIEMSYINNADGGQSIIPVYLSRYELPVNREKQVVSLTLPNVPTICVFSVTATLENISQTYDEIASGEIVLAGIAINEMSFVPTIYNEITTGGIELSGDATGANHFIGFVCKSSNTYRGTKSQYIKTKTGGALLPAITVCTQHLTIIDEHIA